MLDTQNRQLDVGPLNTLRSLNGCRGRRRVVLHLGELPRHFHHQADREPLLRSAPKPISVSQPPRRSGRLGAKFATDHGRVLSPGRTGVACLEEPIPLLDQPLLHEPALVVEPLARSSAMLSPP